jgi:hypothetical protein
MSLNSPYIGYVNKETVNNLVISEEQNERKNLSVNVVIRAYPTDF